MYGTLNYIKLELLTKLNLLTRIIRDVLPCKNGCRAHKWMKNSNKDLYSSHQLNISGPLAQVANAKEAIRAAGQELESYPRLVVI